MGISPREAVMIGDSPVDTQAARAAGIRVGLVSHGFVSKEEMTSSHPDWLVDSLKEFDEILH
jgi:phosphoglycolate phosphatase